MSAMKNWEALRKLAGRRQTGYTTAVLAAVNNASAFVLVAEHEAKKELESINRKVWRKEGGCLALAAEGAIPWEGSYPLIPDNGFLRAAVREAEGRIAELEDQLKKRNSFVPVFLDWVHSDDRLTVVHGGRQQGKRWAGMVNDMMGMLRSAFPDELIDARPSPEPRSRWILKGAPLGMAIVTVTVEHVNDVTQKVSYKYDDGTTNRVFLKSFLKMFEPLEVAEARLEPEQVLAYSDRGRRVRIEALEHALAAADRRHARTKSARILRNIFQGIPEVTDRVDAIVQEVASGKLDEDNAREKMRALLREVYGAVRLRVEPPKDGFKHLEIHRVVSVDHSRNEWMKAMTKALLDKYTSEFMQDMGLRVGQRWKGKSGVVAIITAVTGDRIAYEFSGTVRGTALCSDALFKRRFPSFVGEDSPERFGVTSTGRTGPASKVKEAVPEVGSVWRHKKDEKLIRLTAVENGHFKYDRLDFDGVSGTGTVKELHELYEPESITRVTDQSQRNTDPLTPGIDHSKAPTAVVIGNRRYVHDPTYDSAYDINAVRKQMLDAVKPEPLAVGQMWREQNPFDGTARKVLDIKEGYVQTEVYLDGGSAHEALQSRKSFTEDNFRKLYPVLVTHDWKKP